MKGGEREKGTKTVAARLQLKQQERGSPSPLVSSVRDDSSRGGSRRLGNRVCKSVAEYLLINLSARRRGQWSAGKQRDTTDAAAAAAVAMILQVNSASMMSQSGHLQVVGAYHVGSGNV